MGRNRFREDALKYWDIRCEDAWTRFEEAVRENPYLTAKEFCIKDMGCVDPFMKWARRTKHSITRLRRQALDERKRAKGLERRNSTDDPTPGNMFIQFVPKKEAGRCSTRSPAAAVSAASISSNISRMSSTALPRWEQRLLRTPAGTFFPTSGKRGSDSHF